MKVLRIAVLSEFTLAARRRLPAPVVIVLPPKPLDAKTQLENHT
jgi:hypothetical protein